MPILENQISIKLKERFCKDCNISIQVFDEPYFTERIKLFHAEDRWAEFVELLKSFNSEQEYFEYYNNLKDNIINYIKESKAYNELQNLDLNDKSFREIMHNTDANVTATNVYKDPNDKKAYVSIDLAKGNFSALVNFSRANTPDELFNDGSYDYEVFMSRFTDRDYFKKSKYIRQVVFGNCNPKRQIFWESFQICRIKNYIETLKNSDTIQLRALCSDEIVYEVKDLADVLILKNIIDNRTVCKDLPLHFTAYHLHKVNGVRDTFVLNVEMTEADNNSNKYVIKGGTPVARTYVQRYLNKEEAIEDDKVFMSEYGLAKVLNTPEISIDL